MDNRLVKKLDLLDQLEKIDGGRNFRSMVFKSSTEIRNALLEKTSYSNYIIWKILYTNAMSLLDSYSKIAGWSSTEYAVVCNLVLMDVDTIAEY